MKTNKKGTQVIHNELLKKVEKKALAIQTAIRTIVERYPDDSNGVIRKGLADGTLHLPDGETLKELIIEQLETKFSTHILVIPLFGANKINSIAKQNYLLCRKATRPLEKQLTKLKSRYIELTAMAVNNDPKYPTAREKFIKELEA